VGVVIAQQREDLVLVRDERGFLAGHCFQQDAQDDGHTRTVVSAQCRCREDKLEALAARVVAVDLSDPAGPAKLTAEVATVDVLVNNAGFGDFGPFADASPTKLDEMVELNVGALTRLTRTYLPGMFERGSGRVMNVASTAAFQPGPLMAVYYATKAYVLSLSEALAEESRGTGVTVMALCPGPTASGFQAGADMESSRLVKAASCPVRRVLPPTA
jgi:short-subunit dehydrogenase